MLFCFCVSFFHVSLLCIFSCFFCVSILFYVMLSFFQQTRKQDPTKNKAKQTKKGQQQGNKEKQERQRKNKENKKQDKKEDR